MAESVENKINLKVGIYPWIPDLGNDKLKGLKDLIKLEFEREHPDITVTISSDWDPYDVEAVAANLSSKEESFDILEIDTILLGEVVEKGVVQQLNLSQYGLQDDFFAVALDAVSFKGCHYGVPTLNCANFLIELISGNLPPSSEILLSLETGDHNLGDLQQVVRRYHKLFKGVSKMVGNFRGKWMLPMMYLDAYVDKYGKGSVEEGVDAPIDEPDSDVLQSMKWFMNLDDDTDGVDKGAEGKYDSPTTRDQDLSKSDHIMMYGYSEWLSQVMSDKMCQQKHIHASCIIAPPLGAENNLLTFTDALIANRSRFSDKGKEDAIVKFLKFYTSLSFRNQYAEGQDLKKPHPPRYVLVSRKDFYTVGFGAKDKNYQHFYKALEYAVAAPNHGLASRHEKMNAMLVEKLHLPPKN